MKRIYIKREKSIKQSLTDFEKEQIKILLEDDWISSKQQSLNDFWPNYSLEMLDKEKEINK